MICKVPGCTRALHSCGYCGAHYQRARRYGDPLVVNWEWNTTIRIDPSTGCHEWQGFKRNGYATGIVAGRKVSLARVVLEKKLGRPIKPGFGALHNCGNPPCINEEHLWEGTPLDNAKDRTLQNREPWGNEKPNAKLDESAVDQIRGRLSKGEQQTRIAKDYGISPSVISRINSGGTWRRLCQN